MQIIKQAHDREHFSAELLEKEWVKNFQNSRDDLRKYAKECITKIQRENRATFNKKRKLVTKYNE